MALPVILLRDSHMQQLELIPLNLLKFGASDYVPRAIKPNQVVVSMLKDKISGVPNH